MSDARQNGEKNVETNAEKKTTWVEEIEVAGEQLVDFVKKMAAEGQVRRLRILEPDGDIAVDIPLTVGAIAGGAVVIAAPVLAVLGALAAFVAKVKVEIIRDAEAPQQETGESGGEG